MLMKYHDNNSILLTLCKVTRDTFIYLIVKCSVGQRQFTGPRDVILPFKNGSLPARSKA